MGSGSLTNRSSGQTILETFWNDIHGAFNGDFVGRNSSGVATSGQSLGTVALPWGTLYVDGIVLDGAAVDTSQLTAQANRVISGVKRATSNQPAFIVPNGAAASFIIDGTPTPLVLDVNGTTFSVTTDITKSSLTAAPAANNTCLVNDTDAADQHDTRLWGEPWHRKTIVIDTVGSNITALVGKYASFKIDNGSATEYFYAFVESATVLSDVRRGFFYDSSLNPKNRIVFSNNDTITLMSTAWIFVENNGTTVDVSYNNPVWDFTAPSSPATGDYWYDLSNGVWKRYDGASFVIINRVFVGMALIDTTNCVAARCVDFWKKPQQENSISVIKQSTEIVRAVDFHQKVYVNGTLIHFGHSRPSWNMTVNLAAAVDMYDSTEQASRIYYAYVKDDGAEVISDITPYKRDDLLGWYHPHNPWRCVGLWFNDSGNNIQGVSSVDNPVDESIFLYSGNGYGSTWTTTRRYSTVARNTLAGFYYEDSAANGATFTCAWPGRYNVRAQDEKGGTATAIGYTKNLPSANQTDGISTAFVADPAAFGGGYVGLNATSDSQCLDRAQYFKIGDLVRVATDGVGSDALVSAQAIIERTEIRTS